MSSKILQKCLDALNQETVSLDYVRGMLETLIEMQEQPEETRIVRNESIAAQERIKKQVEPSTDEASILDAKAKAAIKAIEAMGGNNTPI